MFSLELKDSHMGDNSLELSQERFFQGNLNAIQRKVGTLPMDYWGVWGEGVPMDYRAGVEYAQMCMWFHIVEIHSAGRLLFQHFLIINCPF